MSIFRRYIEIVEGSASSVYPTDPGVLHAICGLLNAWVTQAPVPDDLMDVVMHQWPRPQRAIRLWRVQILSAEQAAELANGLLVIPVHRYLSWTASKEAVDRLAMARHGNGGVPAVLCMTVPASRICINVADFVDYALDLERTVAGLDFDTADLTAYADEAEVIVFHPAPLRLTSRNTRLYRARRSDPPQLGDMVFMPHQISEDGFAVTEVGGQNADGSWHVAWDNDEGDVHFVAPGEWEVTER